MKVKKMLFSILLLILLLPFSVFASEKVEITSIRLASKSENTVVSDDATFDGMNVHLHVRYTDVDEYVKYEIEIWNHTNVDYQVTNDSISNDDPYIEFFVDSNTSIPAQSKSTVLLTVHYKTEVGDENFSSGIYHMNHSSYIRLMDLVNPHTGNKTIYIIVIMFVLIAVSLLSFKTKKIYLLLILFLIPLSIKAAETLRIAIHVDVDIQEKNIIEARYAVTDGVYDTSVEKDFWQYGSQVERLYIMNHITPIETYDYQFDVSSKKNQTIMAYLIKNGNQGTVTNTETNEEETVDYYDLKIMANGNIYANSDSAYMFDHFIAVNLVEGLGYLKTDLSTTMRYMFSYLKSLEELDLGHFNTSHVSDFSFMFLYSNFKNINISSFDTSKATTLASMFGHCLYLETVDVSHFNTSKVTTFNQLFVNDHMINHLDVSGWDTSSAVDMYKIFRDCPSLEHLDVSHWDTSNVTNMAYMFSNCRVLKDLDLSHFNTSKVTNMVDMFSHCSDVNNFHIQGFDTSQVTSMGGMFSYIQDVVLDIHNFDTSQVTSMKDMFRECPNLTTIYVSEKWDVSNVTSHSNMFRGDTNLVGAVPFGSVTGVSMANYETGYLTYKALDE